MRTCGVFSRTLSVPRSVRLPPSLVAASYAVGMQLTEMSATGFRTRVAVFRRPADGLRWVIIPTIHWRWDVHDQFPDGLRHGRDILDLLRAPGP